MKEKIDLCPCGSGNEKSACCARLHEGEVAQTAEALMRSRFTAYVLKDETYILKTWHPETRPQKLDLAKDKSRWFKLEILNTRQGKEDDTQGSVEFRASYSNGNEIGQLHEVSQFVRQDGQWYYKQGELKETNNNKIKIGRNDPCICGSGKKYKKCCGA